MKMIAAFALALSIGTAGMAQAHTRTDHVEVLDSAGFSGVIAQRQDLFVGSQPDEAGLKRMADAGVKVIINLRRDSEMERLTFDEAATIEKLGMRYVRVPQGGSAHPYNPEALDKVSAAIAGANGEPVLLHCASGARASHMFSAWLYREKGLALKEALAEGRKIGLSRLPIEGLLGAEFEMRIPKKDASTEK